MAVSAELLITALSRYSVPSPATLSVAITIPPAMVCLTTLDHTVPASSAASRPSSAAALSSATLSVNAVCPGIARFYTAASILPVTNPSLISSVGDAPASQHGRFPSAPNPFRFFLVFELFVTEEVMRLALLCMLPSLLLVTSIPALLLYEVLLRLLQLSVALLHPPSLLPLSILFPTFSPELLL